MKKPNTLIARLKKKAPLLLRKTKGVKFATLPRARSRRKT